MAAISRARKAAAEVGRLRKELARLRAENRRLKAQLPAPVPSNPTQ